MGSNKVKQIDLSEEEKAKQAEEESKKKKAEEEKDKEKEPSVDWQEIYSDLSTRTANALKEARLQPAQITKMEDGEITAVKGIGEKGLEEIREKYSPTMSNEEIAEKTPLKTPKKKKGKKALPPNKRHLHSNSKRFQKAKEKVDKTKLYPLKEAVELVKKTNVARFNATLTLHLKLKDRKPRFEVEFPHSTGTKKKIAIANDKTLKKIEKGEIDFDILLASPNKMSDLAKHAPLLGPQGLMPNPKAGTLTDDPETKKKELESGTTLVKCERKEPLMHVSVGKVKQDTQEIIENIEALINTVNPKKILKATLASTISPGIKVFIEK